MNNIYELITTSTSRDYWAQRLHLSATARVNIDWEAAGRAYSSLQFPRQRRITKFLSHQCATGKIMLRWKFWDHDKCPRCNNTEDNIHVITCPDPRAQQTWDTSISILQEWLTNYGTSPTLQDLLINRLNNLRVTSNLPNYEPSILSLHFSQEKIGWFPAINGLLSTHWEATQQLYFRHIKSTKSGRTWVIALIKKLWQVSWDMWDHRNSVLHDNEESQQKLLLRQELQSKILSELSQPRANFNHLHKSIRSLTPAKIKTMRIIALKRVIRSIDLATPSNGSSIQHQRAFMQRWLSQPNTTLPPRRNVASLRLSSVTPRGVNT